MQQQPAPLPAPAPLAGGGITYGPGGYNYQPNGSGGYNYFNGSTPITNTQFGAATGVDYGALEAQALSAYNAANPSAQTTTGGTQTNTTSGGGTIQQQQPDYATQIQQLLGQTKGIVDQYNGLYNTLYGNYNQGVQGQRDLLDQNYANQYGQAATQYGQAVPQISNMMAARGLESSSYAGTQQDNLSNNYANQNAAISADQNAKNYALSQKSAGDLANYHGTQDSMNAQFNNMQQYLPQDASGQYQLMNFFNGLQGGMGNMNSQVAQTQSGGDLMNGLNQIAPSQIYNPQALQQQLTNLSHSTIPQFAQQQLASGAIQSNTQNPVDMSYWLQYAKNLATPQAA